MIGEQSSVGYENEGKASIAFGTIPTRYADRDVLAAETDAAKASSIPWQHRGPPGPSVGGPSKWRKQKHREGTHGGLVRWGNPGGKHVAKASAKPKAVKPRKANWRPQGVAAAEMIASKRDRGEFVYMAPEASSSSSSGPVDRL